MDASAVCSGEEQQEEEEEEEEEEKRIYRVFLSPAL
jgi:hypothetical protein